ncbi:conserved protein, unknown function [Hepatocystis sp. ex Piliocolobus tephrosceles]|nr:conserved protein, unknown function [Hepatocystis sp. ex Piliocolobus tephrosceles]
MFGLLRRKRVLCSFILFLAYIDLRLVKNKRKCAVNTVLNKIYYPNKRETQKKCWYYILKHNKVNKKKNRKKNNNELYESCKKRPERKIDCYELNIRNDKYFLKYAKKPVSPMSNLHNFSPFKNIIASFHPINFDVKKKLREEGFQFESEKTNSNIFPSLDDIIKNGNPSTNMHFYRRQKLKSIFYRDPLKFVNTKKVIQKYNRTATPEKQINYDTFKCDIFYVHSDGTIMNIEENRPPYEKKLEESEKEKEPRFVIMAPPGHAKEENLKVGDKFPTVNEEHKKNLFDNHFAKPKKIRDPLVLPDGRKIP